MRLKANDYEVRLAPHQLEAWPDESRFDVRVWHRRAGKSYFTILRQLTRLVEHGKGDWQAFYVAPTRTQAKQIAWPYVQLFSQYLGGELNIAELKCQIPNKGFLQLANGEQYDRLRGLYADDVTLDEAADIPEAAWTEVISPMISDRKGRFTAMGTPRGKLNLLWKLWDRAGHDPEWRRSLLGYDQTNMVDPGEIERNRAQQSEAQFAQEWECSWEGATPGAYFGKEMSRASAEGRVTQVRYDSALPVIASLDLGHHDLMPVIFSQEAGTELRILGCRTYQFTSLPDMVRDLRSLEWPIDRMIVPHDAQVRELGSGQTRTEVLTQLGLEVSIAPKLPLGEGIEQTRRVLEHCWFNADTTEHLREGLAQYRSEYDELRGVHRLTPLHDQASHYADAMRYLATGDRATMASWGPRRTFKGTI